MKLMNLRNEIVFPTWWQAILLFVIWWNYTKPKKKTTKTSHYNHSPKSNGDVFHFDFSQPTKQVLLHQWIHWFEDTKHNWMRFWCETSSTELENVCIWRVCDPLLKKVLLRWKITVHILHFWYSHSLYKYIHTECDLKVYHFMKNVWMREKL